MTTATRAASAANTQSMPSWGKSLVDFGFVAVLVGILGTVFGFYGLWTDSWIWGLVIPLALVLIAMIGINLAIRVAKANETGGKAIGFATVIVDAGIVLGALALTQSPTFVFNDFGLGALCASVLIIGFAIANKLWRWLVVKFN